MSSKRSQHQVHLTTSVDQDTSSPEAIHDGPFCIALIGDFTAGGSAQAGRGLSSRRPVLIDRDNVDQVLSRFAPKLELSLGETSIPVHITEMDDFHPDRLYEKLPVFRAMQETRQRLADPNKFADLVGARAEPGESSGGSSSVVDAGSGFLDRIIEQTADPSKDVVSTDLRQVLNRVVAPHLVSEVQPKQAELLAQVDDATTSLMRWVLHHRRFQALEALWRGVFFLTRRIETSKDLRLYLIDASKDELQADLDGERELSDTESYKILVESTVGTPGADRWAVLVGVYSFGADPGDTALLGGLGALARRAGAPWISGGDPALVGCRSIDQLPDPGAWAPEPAPGWEGLRRSADAPWIGISLPRFLLRLPYGRQTDSCEALAFEEFEGTPEHEDYLWGNPALCCALLLAEAFGADGRPLRVGAHRDISGLPLHLFKEGGETLSKPCAEVLVTDRVAERLLDSGPMPLVSFKDSDRIMLARFQSISSTPRPLAGF